MVTPSEAEINMQEFLTINQSLLSATSKLFKDGILAELSRDKMVGIDPDVAFCCTGLRGVASDKHEQLFACFKFASIPGSCTGRKVTCILAAPCGIWSRLLSTGLVHRYVLAL